MSLSTLLSKLQPVLEQHVTLLPAPWPACQLFFSVSSGEERALVVNVTGENFAQAWEKGTRELQRQVKRQKLKVTWLKADWTKAVRSFSWHDFRQDELLQTKRNYYRYGLALDPELKYSFLEQELNASATLYMGGSQAMAELNEKNFTRFAHLRYHKKVPLDFSDEQTVYRLEHRGVFCALDEAPQLLSGPGRDAGRRILEQTDEVTARRIISSSSEYLAGQVLKEGRFNYGWHPCFDRPIRTYNTLRHASSTYAMLEAWEVTQSAALMAAAKRSLRYLSETLIQRYERNGESVAFLTDLQDEIKLGGNAVCLLAMTKYTELTGDQQYLPLLEQLALGIRSMQNPDKGSFVHVLHSQDLSVKEAFRTIYYEGEAAFGLMRLYGLTRDERWLKVVTDAFEYFIEKDHWKTHDHWLSYCVNELTLYRPEARYYEFGIKNFAGHLDFVLERITTFPTLLELMMAAHKMISRLKQQPEFHYLLEAIDLDKFDRALRHRAQYLMNGYFWPECAMYFKNPARILGSCYIRHHAFRVRIDDVEHYLSGYVAYLHYYLGIDTPRRSAQTGQVDASPHLPVHHNTSSEISETAERPESAPVSGPNEVLSGANEVLSPDTVEAVNDKRARLAEAIRYKEGFNWNSARLLQATRGKWLVAPGPEWRSTGLCIHAPTLKAGQMVVVRPDDDKRYIPEERLMKLPFFPQAILTQDDKVPDGLPSCIPVLKVHRVDRAVLDIGNYARHQLLSRVVGVTGSSGKTTTVAMLAQTLSAYGSAAQTMNNANLPKGIAWNIASVPWDSDYVVLEMAIGSMPLNAQMVQPDVAVFTNVAPAHLEYHKTTDEIARKKSQIFSHMKAGGYAVINRDMTQWPIVEQAARERLLRIISYGEHEQADIRLTGFQPDQGLITVQMAEETLSFTVSAGGKHLALNALACLGVLKALELPSDAGLAVLDHFKPVSGRGESRCVTVSGARVEIINDAYNANPLSLSMALENFNAQRCQGKKRLVLGDMLELGPDSAHYHASVVPDIVRCQADKIYLVGEEMVKLADSLREQQCDVQCFESLESLQSTLTTELRDQDSILFKSSNGIGLQQVVRSLSDMVS